MFAPIGGLLLYASAQVSIFRNKLSGVTFSKTGGIDIEVRCKNSLSITPNVPRTPLRVMIQAPFKQYQVDW